MDDYLKKRQQWQEKEQSVASDASTRVDLTFMESKVNRFLCTQRQLDLERFRNERNGILPAQSSVLDMKDFLAGASIQQTHSLWHMIRTMPKGAVLHAHIDSMVDIRWLIEHATYQEHCYLHSCKKTGRLTFRFFRSDPNVLLSSDTSHSVPGDKPWIRVQEARQQYSTASNGTFDDWLYDCLTLRPEMKQGLSNFSDQDIWSRFLNTFLSAGGLINYLPVFRAYLLQTFQTLVDDGVMYIEERMVVQATQLYEADGTTFPLAYTIQVYQETLRDFLNQRPSSDLNLKSFMGAKLIYCGLKVGTLEMLQTDLDLVRRLKEMYPDIIAVGYEEGGSSLLDFAPALLEFQKQCNAEGLDIPFVWHAGETILAGSPADTNLLDALILGSRRIGHGLSAMFHPHLTAELRSRQIALEVCPISNQTLKYISNDLRLHPLAQWISQGLEIVLSPDDPAIFCVGEQPMSYDFWASFVTWATWDLATLKWLCQNSIKHSLMSPSSKLKAMALWQLQWDQWISGIHYHLSTAK